MKYSNLKNRSGSQSKHKPNLKFKRPINDENAVPTSPGGFTNKSISLLSESLLVSPMSMENTLTKTSTFKLSNCILKNPKCISDNHTKLSLVEKNIQELDDLQSQRLQSVETLYLSNNHLQSLKQIGQFPMLKNLSLTYNSISSMKEFYYLQNLDYLECLRVEGNPICSVYPEFRKVLIYMLPLVKNIDGVSVSEGERIEAEVVYQKQQSLIKMLHDNDFVVCILKKVMSKVKMHSHMVGLGYLMNSNTRGDIDLEYIVKFMTAVDNGNFNEWFERSFLKVYKNSATTTNLNDTFNKGSKQVLTWDQKFSEYIVNQQQQIAQLKQQIKSQLQQQQANHQRQKSTPRMQQTISNSLFGIQSPRIIESERSNHKSPIRGTQNQQSNILQSNQSIISSYNKSLKKPPNSGGSKKRSKKKSNISQDMKGMNLTKILEVKENTGFAQDSNLLLDQTFSGLLMNEDDTSHFLPRPKEQALIDTISPNSIINNRAPRQAQPPKPMTEDLQFSLEILERIEALEIQLRAKDSQNDELQTKNRLLVNKIKEFQEQNRSNVQQATTEIVTLQKQLKNVSEQRDYDLELKQGMEQNLEFLEEENKILSQRLQEIEATQTFLQEQQQQMQEHLYEKGKLEVALNMHSFHLKRKWFTTFQRSVYVTRKLRLYLAHKHQKQNNYLKLISFLYIRQEAALNKHMHQMHQQKLTTLKYMVMHKLYQNKQLQHKWQIFQKRVHYRLKSWLLRCLYIAKQILEQRKRQKHNALQVRRILLKNKGFKGLKVHLRQRQLPCNPQTLQHYNKVVRTHRKRVYFQQIRQICQYVLPYERKLNKKAVAKYHRSLIGQCFNQVFKNLIKRKKEIRVKLKAFRIQHAQNLLVKAYSALLFSKIDHQSKYPLLEKQQAFTKLRFLNKWHRSLLYKRNLESKLKFYRLRWVTLKKKIYLRILQQATLRQHVQDKISTFIQSRQKHRIQRVCLSQWITQLREELLEQRCLKYFGLKAFKTVLRQRHQKFYRINKWLYKQQSDLQAKTFSILKKHWKKRIQDKQCIQEFRSKHVDKVVKTTFYKMLSICFSQFMQRQRDELQFLQDKITPLQTTFEEKESQMTYFLNKCCDLEQENEGLLCKVEQLHKQQEIFSLQKENEVQNLKAQIDRQASVCSDLEQQKADLEVAIQTLQVEQLRKLEEYKNKFVKSEQEILKLREDADKENRIKEYKKESEEHNEKANNIKLLHQLKKAHKTMDEMRKALMDTETLAQQQRKDMDLIRKKHDTEREDLMTKHIGDIKEITYMVEKVKRENTDLKKEVHYLTDKMSLMKQQQQQVQIGSTKRVRFQSDQQHHHHGDIDRYPSKI